jgi:acetyl esterase/lipase
MSNRLNGDPRIDPRIKAVLGGVPCAPAFQASSREEIIAAFAAIPAGENPLEVAINSLDFASLAPEAGLDIRTIPITSSPDGNRINLQVITPAGPGPWPCVYYIHGGGMALMSCHDANYRAWGRMIAHRGVVVVMVDFRNSLLPSSVPEVAPYPAGLNDCVSGLHWLRANTDALNVDGSRIILAGESGGANLSLATLLKLKRDGGLDDIKGLYLMCPYLQGEWAAEPGSSALENSGIIMDLRQSNWGSMGYGIEAWRAKDPLAWPGFASEADLAGLPPVVINVNECDPLRDDGVELYRKLLRAGVPARCRQLMGTTHGTEIFLICPDVSADVARDMAAFCAG